MRRTGLFTDPVFNPNRKDALGCDPFGLRAITAVAKRSFAEALHASCLNIDDVDLSKFDLAEAPDYVVPHRLFYIWFGSAFTEKEFQGYMTEWREKNPDCIIIIFTDQVKSRTHYHLKATSEDYQQMLGFAKAQQVCIVNHAEFITATAQLYMGLIKQNYGLASDIFRLDLLQEMAGIYVDVDIHPMKLPDVIRTSIGFAINRSGVKAMNSAAAGLGGEKPFSNDFLMRASGNHQGLEVLRDIRQQLLTNMQIGWDALFKAHYKVAPNKYLLTKEEFIKKMCVSFHPQKIKEDNYKHYERINLISYSAAFHQGEFYRLDNIKLKKVVTEVTSGPELVIDYQDRCDDVGPYAAGFTASWLSFYTPLINETHNETCQRLVTIILFDLTQDPKTLRFDTLPHEFRDPVIMKTVMQMLRNHFLLNLNTVEKIILANNPNDLYYFCRISQLYQEVQNLLLSLHTGIQVLLFPGQATPFNLTKFIENEIHYVYLTVMPKSVRLQFDLLPDIETSIQQFAEAFCKASNYPLDVAELNETLNYFILENLAHLYRDHDLKQWLDRFLQLNHQNQLRLIREVNFIGSLYIENIEGMQQIFSDHRFPQDCRDIIITELQSTIDRYKSLLNNEIEDINKELADLDPNEISNTLNMLTSTAVLNHEDVTPEKLQKLNSLIQISINDVFADASDKIRKFAQYCHNVIMDQIKYGLMITLHKHLTSNARNLRPPTIS